MFRWVTDVSRGDWIRERLGPFGSAVGSVLPRGFEAYARVLHPVPAEDGVWLRWVDVAAVTGAVLHPTAQWWRVAGRPEGYGHGGAWDGNDPHQGDLDPVQLAALVEVLRASTESDAVTAAFWEGSSWEGGARLVVLPPRRPWLRRRPHPVGEPTGGDVDARVLDGPKLELPQRHHLVFAGSLDDVAALAAGTATADVSPFRPGRRTPSLLWPDDRTWCVATAVDFDSTLVGGPRALVDAVLADETLEAFEVGVDDSLGASGDAVNR